MMLPCCVPFCERYRRHRKGAPIRVGEEFICQDHWRLAPTTWRRRLRLFQRKGRPDLAAQVWGKIRAIVIERAAGISG